MYLLSKQMALVALLCVAPVGVSAQELRLFDRAVQVHGFASQGFVYTDDNNWLTMHSNRGSGAFTDFGFNVSTAISDKLRIGAQVYDRNLGNLGEWHPSLDWAVADYRFNNWIGIRAGKVKTTLGLYNDTQDLDFLRTFALLPQSVYPIDLRDATIAHLGGDIYGKIALPHNLGDLCYTAYAGHRSDSIHSGYPYLLSQYQIRFNSYGGAQYGADLRWQTPLRGLLVGASRLNEDVTGKGLFMNDFAPSPEWVPYRQSSKASWTNQFYAEYTVRKLHIDSEYRRYFRDQVVSNGASTVANDVRGWYVSGSYRIMKRLELGSYYSRYSITSFFGGPVILAPDETDTSLPTNHVYDKVITGRIDLYRFWNVKIEGHFMNGYADDAYPNGFYPQVNPSGYKPNTDALVLKSGFNF